MKKKPEAQEAPKEEMVQEEPKEAAQEPTAVLFSVVPHKDGGWKVVVYYKTGDTVKEIYSSKDGLKHHTLATLEDMLVTYLVDLNGSAENMAQFVSSWEAR